VSSNNLGAAPQGDWIDRLYDAAPLPPYAVGAAIALGLLALVVGSAAATGELGKLLAGEIELFAERNVRLGITLTLLAGYVPTAQRYQRLASRRHLAEIRSATGGARRADDVVATRAGGGRRAGLLGLLLVPFTALVIDRDPSLYLRPGYWGAGTLWAWTAGVLFCWSLGRFAHATLESARAFSAVADELERIDLLGRDWLTPFAREGLFSALLWLVIPTVFTINLTDEPLLYVMAPLTLICVSIGTIALLLPSRGARRRLRATKREEIARVHRAIRGDTDALQASVIGGRRSEPSIADLLAYERFLQSISSWPFDQATWLRFGLVLALPLGSWLGGAVVERLLSSLLD
jgi:hypothetical protein